MKMEKAALHAGRVVLRTDHLRKAKMARLLKTDLVLLGVALRVEDSDHRVVALVAPLEGDSDLREEGLVDPVG